MAQTEFTAQGYGLRLLAALLLVFATYNPEGYSYYHWLVGRPTEIGPALVLAGLALIIAWTVFLRATLRSLGGFGLLLACGFFGALIWLVLDTGWVATDSHRPITYLAELALAGVLATGMSWSHIRRRLSGQADVDDV